MGGSIYTAYRETKKQEDGAVKPPTRGIKTDRSVPSIAHALYRAIRQRWIKKKEKNVHHRGHEKLRPIPCFLSPGRFGSTALHAERNGIKRT